MVMILPRQPSWGEVLGQALGGSVAGGIEGWQEAKLKNQENLAYRNAANLAQGKPIESGLEAKLDALKGPAEGGQPLAQRPPLSRSEMLAQAYAAKLPAGVIANLEKSYDAQEQNAIARENLELKKGKQKASEVREQRTQQAEIDKANEPYLSQFKTLDKPYAQLDKSVDSAIKLVESGKAESGILGGIGPNRLRNKETQALQAELKRIVALMTSVESGLGNPTDAKVKLIEDAKASLSQPIEVQKQILYRIKDDVKDYNNQKAAVKALTKDNGGRQPRDIHFAVDDYVKQKEEKEIQREINDLNEHLPASRYPGKKSTNDKGLTFISDGKTWRKL